MLIKEVFSVELKMLVNETGYEIIAVIITILNSNLNWGVLLVGGINQSIGLQLLREKAVIFALVDKDRQWGAGLAKQFHRIVCFPSFSVMAKVRGKCFYAPWSSGGVANRTES